MTKKERSFIDAMKRVRGIDFARIGMMVEFDGHVGTIEGITESATLLVRPANQLRFGKRTMRLHPTYNIRYFSEHGEVLKDYPE